MRALLAAPILACLALPAWADARLTVLVDVLQLREAAAILRDEGLAHAAELERDMLEGRGGAGWRTQVEAIYDPERMVEAVRGALGAELEGAALEETVAFFGSDLGTRIVTLENAARAAMIAPDIEAAARDRHARLSEAPDARFAQVADFIASGDMITRNVTSAMNANVQFLRGLAAGDAVQMDEAEILADVAGALEEITADTESWLFGFLLLAYHPLTDAELARYLAFSETRAGQALNRALFDGFGAAYEDISYALGRAVALNMTAEEL